MAAAAWEGPRCRGIRTVRPARCSATRDKVLQKRQKRAAGQGGVGDGRLWRYVANLDASAACQVTAEGWSRRRNRKRAYRRRGKVLEHVRHLAPLPPPAG